MAKRDPDDDQYRRYPAEGSDRYTNEVFGEEFPGKPKPDAVLISGSTKFTIKEWVVPTSGSRPHDPLATTDGALWYAGQYANMLGRLYPHTGKIKEYRLKTPPTQAHTVWLPIKTATSGTPSTLEAVSASSTQSGGIADVRVGAGAATHPQTIGTTPMNANMRIALLCGTEEVLDANRGPGARVSKRRFWILGATPVILAEKPLGRWGGLSSWPVGSRGIDPGEEIFRLMAPSLTTDHGAADPAGPAGRLRPG